MNRGRSRKMPGQVPPGAEVVHSITTAAQAHSDDMDLRIRRYLISMGIRTLCVILVLVVPGPTRWVFAVLAIVLPYIAVVMANAAGSRRGTGATPVPRTALPNVTKGENPVTVRVSPEQPNSHSHEQTA